MLRGEFAGWIKSNEFHLERHAKITAKNKLIIESFKKLSSWNIFERLFIFFKIDYIDKRYSAMSQCWWLFY